MYPEGFFVWHLQRVKLFLSDTQMVNERRPNTSFWFRLTREPPFGIGSVKRRQPSTDPWLRRWLISRSYLRVIFPWFKDVLLAERKPSVRRSWLCLDLDMSELNCRALQFVQLGAALFFSFFFSTICQRDKQASFKITFPCAGGMRDSGGRTHTRLYSSAYAVPEASSWWKKRVSSNLHLDYCGNRKENQGDESCSGKRD